MTAGIPARFAAYRNEIYDTSFTPDVNSRRVGAEVELLVHDEHTGRPLPLLGSHRSVVELVRAHAARYAWREIPSYGSVPRFEILGKGIISFEPGGQLELSTTPCVSVGQLVASIRSVMLPLRDAFADQGVQLVSVGIDPRNDARDIPLQLPVERYETMTRYFDRRGPFGVRMMRQTAAIQVSLDRGPRPAERWRLLNDLAPYVIAIFANSPHYLGRDVGHRSYRAHCWRMLDPSRTGVAASDLDPAAEYTRFALAATHMASSLVADTTFAEYDAGGSVTDAWRGHLTTLFPEVRPRGHFEVRSCDAIPPELYPAPLVFLAGLVYDDWSAREAALLAAESRALLRAAGEHGLRDALIARTSRDLFQLALAGARRLGDRSCGGEALETAAAFFDSYTARDRSPADDRVLPAHRSAAPARLSATAPTTTT